MTRYPFRRGPLALELASTIFAVDGQVRDGLSTPADLAAWLSTNYLHVPNATGASHLDTFRTLRDAVRELFGAAVDGHAPASSAVALLNDVSAAAPQWTRLDWVGSSRHGTAVEVADDAVVVALAMVARSCIDVLSGPARDRLGRCRAPGCVLFFSRERGRREWCSAQCGNRARVARHYQRHHVRADRA